MADGKTDAKTGQSEEKIKNRGALRNYGRCTSGYMRPVIETAVLRHGKHKCSLTEKTVSRMRKWCFSDEKFNNFFS